MKFRTPMSTVLLLSLMAVEPWSFAQGQGADKAPATSGAAGKGVVLPAASAGVASSAPVPSGAAPVSSAASASSAASGGAPAPASSTLAAATPAPAAKALDGQTYAVRLRDLEQRVDELKEQIRRSHTRLSLLSDTVLSAGSGGSRADIQFQNELSNAFRIIRVLFVLDGVVQYNKSDDGGALGDQPVIPVFSGSMPPGDHTLQVLLQLQGNGYGVFSYLKGYKFEVRSTHSFTVVEGKRITLQVVGFEKGGATTPLDERPALRFLEKSSASSAVPPASTPTSAPAAAPGTTSVGGTLGIGGKK
jgi:hypothetical protein